MKGIFLIEIINWIGLMNGLLNRLLNKMLHVCCTVIAAQYEMVCVYKNSYNVINCFNSKQK